MFFTPHINYIHKHCAGLITRASQDIFSLHLVWDNYNPACTKEANKRCAVLCLVSWAQSNTTVDHMSQKNTKMSKKKTVQQLPLSKCESLVFEKKLKFFVPVGLFQRSLPKMVTVLSMNHNSQKEKHPLPRSMYLWDCSKLFPNQLLIYCRMVDQLGNLVQNSPRFAPRRSAFLLQPEVTQRSILSHERSLHPNVCCKGSNSYAMSTSQNLDSRHHKWWIKSLKVIFYPFLLMGKPPKKVPKGKDSNSNQAFTLKWDEIRKAAPQNQNKLRFILNFASKNNRLRLLEDSWKKQLRH